MPVPSPRRRSLSFATAAVLGVGLVGLTSVPVYAAEVTVTSFDELVDAIDNANATPEADTIILSGNSADYVFTGDLPVIDTPMHFVGPGSGLLTLDAGSWYVFEFDAAGDASITGLTIANGSWNGIYADATDLVVRDVVVTTPDEVGLVAEGGSVTVENSHFDQGYFFGAVLLAEGTDTITVLNSSFSNSDGPGLLVGVGDSAVATLTGITAEDNAETGVQLYAEAGGSITVTGAELLRNGTYNLDIEAQDSARVIITDVVANDSPDGGGVNVSATDTTEVRVSLLTATGNADDGISVEASGSALVRVIESMIAENDTGSRMELEDDSQVVIERSTLAGNATVAIVADLVDSARVAVTNSTLSGNGSPSRCVAGIDVSGSETSRFTLSHSTVVGNVTATSCPQVGFQVPASVSHSIISGTPWDLATMSTDLVVEYSLIGTTDSLWPIADAAIAAGSGNLVGIDPELGPLADNGGPTLTHLPLEGSPVLNAGNASISGAPSTDQRGETRVAGAAIDIGAVEAPALLAATGVSPAAPLSLAVVFLFGGLVVLLLGRSRRRIPHPQH